MASRHSGLKFGRFLFEFGISGSARSDHGSEEPPFPIWRGTTALLERYYHSSGTTAPQAVVPLVVFGRSTAVVPSYYRLDLRPSFFVSGFTVLSAAVVAVVPLQAVVPLLLPR